MLTPSCQFMLSIARWGLKEKPFLQTALCQSNFFFPSLRWKRDFFPSMNTIVQIGWQMQIHGDPELRSPPWASLIRLQLQHIKTGWITHLPCVGIWSGPPRLQVPLCHKLFLGPSPTCLAAQNELPCRKSGISPVAFVFSAAFPCPFLPRSICSD